MRLVQELGGRNSVDTRIRAASHLLLAALVDLGEVTVPDIASELARRELVLLVRSVQSIVEDLVERLRKLDNGIALASGACAHCGWSREPTPAGFCPRCGALREVRGEPRGAVVPLAERPRGRRR